MLFPFVLLAFPVATLILAALFPTTLTITLMSVTVFFFAAHFFNRFAVRSGKEFLGVLVECPVCVSVFLTWSFTGLVLGLLPKTLILYLTGVSAAGASNRLKTFVLYPLSASAAVELILIHFFHYFDLFWASMLWIAGALTFLAAKHFRFFREAHYDYKGVEQNVVLYSTIFFMALMVTLSQL